MLCLSRVKCYNSIYLSILILVIVSPHVNVSCFPYVYDLFTEIKYLMRLNLLASLQSNSINIFTIVSASSNETVAKLFF